LEISYASPMKAVCAALMDLTVVPALTCCAKETAQKIAHKRASFTGPFQCVNEVVASKNQVQARALDAIKGGHARGCGK